MSLVFLLIGCVHVAGLLLILWAMGNARHDPDGGSEGDGQSVRDGGL